MTKTTVKSVAAKTIKTVTPAKEVELIVDINSLYKTTKAINEAIEKAIFSGTQNQNELQRVALSILVHLDTHKDIRILRHFMQTMPKSLRRDSMAAYFHQYAAVSIDDKGVFHYNKERKCNIKDALQMPWYKAKRETEYKPFNVTEQFEHFIDKCYNRLKKGVDASKGDNLTREQVELLEATFKQLTSIEASQAA